MPARRGALSSAASGSSSSIAVQAALDAALPGWKSNHFRTSATLRQAGLRPLHGLKRRGLLDETLVIWGGEFGRTPMSEKGDGRDHNPWGFTMWMAGGGGNRHHVGDATDEIGLHAVEDRLHVHDLHATILQLLGLDHMGLVYRHKGRPNAPR